MATMGRPKASSQKTLEEAATELFFEQGYDRTSVDDISERVGVSRATFFNYFPSKADVLLVEIDRALDLLDTVLTPDLTLGDGLRKVAESLSAANIPLIVSQSEAMGVTDDVHEVLPARVWRLRRIVGRKVSNPVWQWAVTGAIVEGALAWAKAPEGGSLTRRLDDAFSSLQLLPTADLEDLVQ